MKHAHDEKFNRLVTLFLHYAKWTFSIGFSLVAAGCLWTMVGYLLMFIVVVPLNGIIALVGFIATVIAAIAAFIEYVETK